LEFDRATGLVKVRDLSIGYSNGSGLDIPAVRQVSFDIKPGQVVGLMGESGSGKTTLGLAHLHLLPAGARVLGGTIQFRGQDLSTLDEEQLRRIRGAEVSMIPQEPAMALNPVMRVGDQVAEVIRAHRSSSRRQAREQAMAALEEVTLGASNRIYSAYPHQLSGGQRQRIVIAQAIACRPALIIADEPTTALDLSIQDDTLRLFKRLRDQHGTSFLIISHDPQIFAGFADRIMVMYAGEIVEEGPTASMFARPLHPYTDRLLACLAESLRANDSTSKEFLPVIAGSSPDPANLPSGCSFHPRCPDRMDVCATKAPEWTKPEESRHVRCYKYGD
jgi:peptide/nickel transport system ATP-binding protein